MKFGTRILPHKHTILNSLVGQIEKKFEAIGWIFQYRALLLAGLNYREQSLLQEGDSILEHEYAVGSLPEILQCLEVLGLWSWVEMWCLVYKEVFIRPKYSS